MSDTVYQIVEELVKILALVLACYVVPAVKKWLENQVIHQKAAEAVNAAQQLLGKDNEAKLEYATENLTLALSRLGIKVEEGQIRSLIEAAVFTMKNSSVKKESNN